MAFFILAEDLPSGHIHLFPRTTHFSGTTSTSLSIGNETTANILKETNNAIFKIFFVYFILVCNMIPVSNRYIQNGYILTVDKKLIFFHKNSVSGIRAWRTQGTYLFLYEYTYDEHS